MYEGIVLRPAIARTAAWAASLGAVTAEAVAHREGLSPACARSRLAAAERRGELRSWRPLRGRPALYTLTAAGLRATGLRGERPVRVSAAVASHMIACCEAALALERIYRGCHLAGEAELRRAPALAAVPVAGCSAPARHRADLAVLEPGGRVALAVEVELTVKAPARLLAICRAWARSREIGGVAYLTTPAVRPALERAIASARAEARIAVLDLAEMTDPVTSRA